MESKTQGVILALVVMFLVGYCFFLALSSIRTATEEYAQEECDKLGGAVVVYTCNTPSLTGACEKSGFYCSLPSGQEVNVNANLSGVIHG